MTPYTVYQKPSCISCKKALALLADQGVAATIVDITKTAPPVGLLEALIDAVGVKAAMNTRSSIYKAEGLGQNPPDKTRLLALMQQDANLIKRPLILRDGDDLPFAGFDEAALLAWLAGARLKN